MFKNYWVKKEDGDRNKQLQNTLGSVTWDFLR